MNTPSATLLEPQLIPGCTVATLPPPPPPAPVVDEAEEVLLAYDECTRALNGLVMAEVQWQRELKAITERVDGADESELDRLARLEDELRLAPAKIRALEKRQQSLYRKLQREFGTRFYRVQSLAQEVAREREVRMVARLEKIFGEEGREACVMAARLHPTVSRAIERAQVTLRCVEAVRVEIGMKQLLQLQAEIVNEGKLLAK